MINLSHKKKLFICMPDLPFPARKNGISIRYFPIIAHASRQFDIHLLVISDHPVNNENILLAQQYCSQVSVYVRQSKRVSLIKKLFNRAKTLIPIGVPFTYLHYDEQEISKFLAEEVQGKTYDLALCVLPQHLDHVRNHVSYKRLTMDFIDSPYLNVMRKPKTTTLQHYEAFLIKQWERTLLKKVDYACYISPLDREVGAGKKLDHEKVGIIPNGIFLQDDIDQKIDYLTPTIGFIGHMGYPPNIKAALRLASIYKKIKDDLYPLQLVIIGRDPAPEIRSLAEQNEIIVTGTVDNIWPYVKGIDIFVFPMEIGSGQQNKLLEAMAAGKPVISTAVGNSGVGAEHKKHLLEANTDTEITNAIIQLIKDKQLQATIGDGGKDFVYKNYFWESIHTQLDNTLLAPEQYSN